MFYGNKRFDTGLKRQIAFFAWNIQGSKVNSVWPMCLLQDAVPFFINATAGTTVQGAFDPLNRIADISERNGMWMHVDVSAAGLPYLTPLCNTSICMWPPLSKYPVVCRISPVPNCYNLDLSFLQAAWGGSVLFSKKHKHLVAGIERFEHSVLGTEVAHLWLYHLMFLFHTQSKLCDLEPSQNASSGIAVLSGFVQRYHGMNAYGM